MREVELTGYSGKPVNLKLGELIGLSVKNVKDVLMTKTLIGNFTDKAIMFTTAQGKVIWVPKSVLSVLEYYKDGHRIVLIPEWMAVKRNLV